ncbi:MAG: PH domain-containing protein [Chloroflexota bacterium]|nr:PH domain-containing protein [Chloroflexota bacterium]
MAQQAVVDKREQLEAISRYLVPDEQVLAVLDLRGGGTGFLGITDRRIIFFDKAYLRRKKAMVTVPFSKITTVASEDDESLFTRGFFGSSVLTVKVSDEIYEFVFRGADKAHLAYQLICERL